MSQNNHTSHRNNSGGGKQTHQQAGGNNQRGGKSGNQRGSGNGRRNAQAASRELRRNQDDANTQAGFEDMVTDADKAKLQIRQRKANELNDGTPELKVTPLGGQSGVGSKNMTVIEYGDDALVVDVGFDLGLELPGINYAIPDITYLEAIQHKIRAYVLTHGHLDHVGAAPYILPRIPAPVYGSKFTVGMIEKQLLDSDNASDFEPETIGMNIDNHEKLKVGPFFIEMIRVTHSIPDATAVRIETPVGNIVHTGDFRLDPEPLDHMPTDLQRLKDLGKEGVLLLLAESTNAEKPGRTDTEHTLEQSFHDILHQASGRVFVSTFSTNINRFQMIINAAAESGRQVALDGRSMLSTVELAVKLGYIKIPKGTIIPMKEVPNKSDRDVAVICTGSQGEPNASLERMSTGDHNHVTLKDSDTVVLSSSPIPGNEVDVMTLTNNLMRTGATVYRHATHDIDCCGPLHVSGHANRDELKEMLEMTQPSYIMPNHGPYVHRQRYLGLAEEMGIDRDRVALIDNGEVLAFDAKGKMRYDGDIPTGSVLVDQTGTLVPNLVIKDRLLMSNDGIVVAVLTVDKHTKHILSAPDIISRGFIHMQENSELVEGLRDHLREFTKHRIHRTDLKQFKQELRDEVNSYLFEQTQRVAMVVPVVNVVAPSGGSKSGHKGRKSGKKPQHSGQQKGSGQPSNSAQKQS